MKIDLHFCSSSFCFKSPVIKLVDWGVSVESLDSSALFRLACLLRDKIVFMKDCFLGAFSKVCYSTMSALSCSTASMILALYLLFILVILEICRAFS